MSSQFQQQQQDMMRRQQQMQQDQLRRQQQMYAWQMQQQGQKPLPKRTPCILRAFQILWIVVAIAVVLFLLFLGLSALGVLRF